MDILLSFVKLVNIVRVMEVANGRYNHRSTHTVNYFTLFVRTHYYFNYMFMPNYLERNKMRYMYRITTNEKYFTVERRKWYSFRYSYLTTSRNIESAREYVKEYIKLDKFKPEYEYWY